MTGKDYNDITKVPTYITNCWLSEQPGKSEIVVFRWRSSKVQPSVAQLNEIANIL